MPKKRKTHPVPSGPSQIPSSSHTSRTTRNILPPLPILLHLDRVIHNGKQLLYVDRPETSISKPPSHFRILAYKPDIGHRSDVDGKPRPAAADAMLCKGILEAARCGIVGLA